MGGQVELARTGPGGSLPGRIWGSLTSRERASLGGMYEHTSSAFRDYYMLTLTVTLPPGVGARPQASDVSVKAPSPTMNMRLRP